MKAADSSLAGYAKPTAAAYLPSSLRKQCAAGATANSASGASENIPSATSSMQTPPSEPATTQESTSPSSGTANSILKSAIDVKTTGQLNAANAPGAVSLSQNQGTIPSSAASSNAGTTATGGGAPSGTAAPSASSTTAGATAKAAGTATPLRTPASQTAAAASTSVPAQANSTERRDPVITQAAAQAPRVDPYNDNTFTSDDRDTIEWRSEDVAELPARISTRVGEYSDATYNLLDELVAHGNSCSIRNIEQMWQYERRSFTGTFRDFRKRMHSNSDFEYVGKLAATASPSVKTQYKIRLREIIALRTFVSDWHTSFQHDRGLSSTHGISVKTKQHRTFIDMLQRVHDAL